MPIIRSQGSPARGGRPRNPDIPPRVSEPGPEPDEATPVFGDPLQAIIGPGSKTSLVGEPEDTIPDEIAAIFTSHGLGERSYRCMLKQYPETAAGDDRQAGDMIFVKSWARMVPTLDWIAKNYGPGNYKMIFTWRQIIDGSAKNVSDSFDFTVHESWRREYNKHQRELRMKEAVEERAKIKELKLDQELDDMLSPDSKKNAPSVNPEEAAEQYVDRITNMAQKLGLTKRSGFDFGQYLPALITGLPAIFKMLSDASAARSAQMQQQMMLMLQMANQNQNQIVELVKAQGPKNGRDVTMEMFDMIKETINIKEMLTGDKKEGPVDRIMNIVEGLAPQILQVAALSAEKRRYDPRIQLAKLGMQADPDLSQIKKDPEILKEVVIRMDTVFGWEQTDQILGAIELERPAECAREPDKRAPIDQRNVAQQKSPSVMDDMIEDGEMESLTGE